MDHWVRTRLSCRHHLFHTAHSDSHCVTCCQMALRASTTSAVSVGSDGCVQKWCDAPTTHSVCMHETSTRPRSHASERCRKQRARRHTNRLVGVGRRQHGQRVPRVNATADAQHARALQVDASKVVVRERHAGIHSCRCDAEHLLHTHAHNAARCGSRTPSTLTTETLPRAPHLTLIQIVLQRIQVQCVRTLRPAFAGLIECKLGARLQGTQRVSAQGHVRTRHTASTRLTW